MKKIIEIRFGCDICSQQYDEPEEATKCENLPTEEKELKKDDRVIIVIPLRKLAKQVSNLRTLTGTVCEVTGPHLTMPICYKGASHFYFADIQVDGEDGIRRFSQKELKKIPNNDFLSDLEFIEENLSKIVAR